MTLRVLVLMLVAAASLHAQDLFVPSRDSKAHDVGNIFRVVSSPMGNPFPWYPGPYCEYPRGSSIDHVLPTLNGFEIAALAPPGDTTAYLYANRSMFHALTTTPAGRSPWDTLWTVLDNAVVDIPYWPGYEGVGDQDFVCRYANMRVVSAGHYYRDTGYIEIQRHPLSIEVIQQSSTWNVPPLNDVIIYTYRVIPRGFDLKGVFPVLHLYGGIGNLLNNQVPVSAAIRALDDQSMYFEQEHLAVVADRPFATQGKIKNCIGYRLFPPHRPSAGTLRWTFSDDDRILDPLRDASRRETPVFFANERELNTYMYRLVSSGMVSYGGINRGSGYLSVGPYDVKLGDTLVFWAAEILGIGSDDVRQKAALLDELFERQFRAPRPPPPPHVSARGNSKSITLQWDTGAEDYADLDRGDSIVKPFEGYRLYRSTQSINGPWSLMQEYDIAGDGFGNEFGLDHAYTDAGLLNHFQYYYALTAFSKEDRVLNFPSRESRKALSALGASPGEGPRSRVGEVAAVPNPYRGDIAYHLYNPSWERPTGKWDTWYENDRRIQFINLPEQCEIRIYTLAGDLVDILQHHDPARGYHDWNLTSHVGQAVSSGIYLFTVEDVLTGDVQVGKFVIIK